MQQGEFQISKVKAAALSDSIPKEVYSGGLLIDPFFEVELLDLAALAGSTITVTTTASGGGVDALVEGVGWAAGLTLEASATALAAALDAALKIHDAAWTATASGATVTMTLVGEFATGEDCTVASDTSLGFLLMGIPDSVLEDFSLWAAGEPIVMYGNDMMYLTIEVSLALASSSSGVKMRLSFLPTAFDVDSPPKWFYELANNLQPVVGGLLPVDLVPVEYTIPVTPGRTKRYTVNVPVDLESVRVEVMSDGEPDPDDTVEMGVVRWMRSGSTPSS